MILKELTYSKGQTLQIRAYEPVNVHISAKAELEEGEDVHIAYDGLRRIVDTEVDIMVKILQEPQRVARAGAKEVIARDNKKNDSPF